MATPQATSTPVSVTTPRRFTQIHLSTAIVLMVVTGMLIGLNCIPTLGSDERNYGWPFPIVRFLGELPATIRWDWPLWFNFVSNLLIVLYIGVVWEHLIRRRAAQARVIQPTTVFFAALTSIMVSYLAFYPRAPQPPVKGELCGWPLIIYRDVYYDFDGSESEWETIHTANQAVFLRELGEYYYFTRDLNGGHCHIHVTNRAEDSDYTFIVLQADLLTAILLVLSAAILAEWLALRKARRGSKDRMEVMPIPNINQRSA